MKKKIAIIGSGIAGLTIANLFKTNSDFDFMVYEKEKILSLDEGYGIQLSANSILVLNKIGFRNIDDQKIYNPSKLNFYSIKSNKICDLDLTKYNSNQIKYTTLKRSTLIEFLKNEIYTNHFRFGKKVKKVSKLKEKLLINFTDSTNDLVDFIIVCDGVFSETKSIIENKTFNPHYSGAIAIRSIIKSSEVSDYDIKNISLLMGPKAHIVMYPINKKDELNLVCIIRDKISKDIDTNLIIEKKILSQNNNLKNLFKGNLKSWPIYITNKPAKSDSDKVFYLGDAFHTFIPAMAQGASQSIESANELFNLLSKDLKEIQNLYFKKRLERTKLINNRSKLNYFSFHLSNPLMMKFRNLILKKMVKNDKFLNSFLGSVYKKT